MGKIEAYQYYNPIFKELDMAFLNILAPRIGVWFMWKNSEKEDYLTMSKLGAGVKDTKYWLELEKKDMRYACNILENFEAVPNMTGIKEEYRKDVEKCIEELYQIYGKEFIDKIMNDVCN